MQASLNNNERITIVVDSQLILPGSRRAVGVGTDKKAAC